MNIELATQQSHLSHGSWHSFNTFLFYQSNVQNMALMFYENTEFQGKGIDRWDVSLARDLRYMFWDAAIFDNPDLCSEWVPQLEESTIVNDLFVGTACETTRTPDLRDLPTPFCSECNGVVDPDCFTSNEELREAVVQYADDNGRNTDVARKYGWPSKYFSARYCNA